MKITFTEDHQSVASGNEFYRKGAQADLRRGQGLVDAGVAREGWGPLLDPKISEEIAVAMESLVDEVEAIKDVDLPALTKSELVDLARHYNIGYIGQTKAQLIEALSEV